KLELRASAALASPIAPPRVRQPQRPRAFRHCVRCGLWTRVIHRIATARSCLAIGYARGRAGVPGGLPPCEIERRHVNPEPYAGAAPGSATDEYRLIGVWHRFLEVQYICKRGCRATLGSAGEGEEGCQRNAGDVATPIAYRTTE